ncbi:hypothetical protein V1505DRAFT_372122 [Lipomyces doorenjongii]
MQFRVVSSAFGRIRAILLSGWNLPLRVLMFAQLTPNAGAQEICQDDINCEA